MNNCTEQRNTAQIEGIHSVSDGVKMRNFEDKIKKISSDTNVYKVANFYHDNRRFMSDALIASKLGITTAQVQRARSALTLRHCFVFDRTGDLSCFKNKLVRIDKERKTETAYKVVQSASSSLLASVFCV